MKEKIKIFFAIFSVIILFGISLFLWFMIYSDSAKNKQTRKENIVNVDCDKDSGNCIDDKEIAPKSSEGKKAEIVNSPENKIDRPSQTESQVNITKPISNEKNNTLFNRNITPTTKNELEEESEIEEVADETDNEDSGEEEETDDNISVEVESTD